MAKLLVAFVAVTVVAAIGTAQETICGERQVFKTCGTACPRYCHKAPGPEPCCRHCVTGCECVPGYVKEYIDSDRCVLETQCNRAQKCSKKNQTFYTCGSACPAYCGKPHGEPCTTNCVPGCQCLRPYVYKSKNSTECIPEWECPE